MQILCIFLLTLITLSVILNEHGGKNRVNRTIKSSEFRCKVEYFF